MVVFLLLWFILLNFFLFLLILMDNIPSCPGLCQVGRCPCLPQTLGCLFGSSLEPSLKAGPCCQHLPSDFFFFFKPFLESTEMSYKGSGLLLVVFHFGFSHSLKISS